MRLRKGMAALLAAAMVLTSQSFASVVYADEASNATKEAAIETVVETSVEETAETEIESKKEVEETKETTEVAESKDDEVKDIATDSKESIEELSATTQKVEEAVDEKIETEADETTEDVEDIEDVESSIDALEGDLSVEAVSNADDYFDRDAIKTNGGILVGNGTEFGDTVWIPKETKVIPDNIFKNKSTFTTIQFEEGCVLDTIAPEAFYRSTLTKIVKLPKGVTSIADSVFERSHLQSITFENAASITSIGEKAFADTEIESISLPNCTVVNKEAFARCKKLITVNMETLVTIDEYAFSGCELLDYGMNFVASIETIGAGAFESCGFKKVDISKCVNLKSTTDTMKIGEGAFASNLSLERVALGSKDNITVIPNSMFKGCKRLNDITLSYYIVEIKDSAFEGCAALEKINLARTKIIGSKAFYDCSKLIDVTLEYKDVDEATGVEKSHVAIAKTAFQPKSSTTVTMHGYDTYVKIYASNLAGYKFKTLYDAMKITTDKKNIDKLDIKSSEYPGEMVTFTVSTTDQYSLTDVWFSLYGEYVYPELVSSDKNEHKFRFEMPIKPIELHLEAASNDSLISKGVSYAFAIGVGDWPTKDAEDEYSWDITGKTAKFVMMDEKGSHDAYGNWLFTYSSSDPKIVTVTSDGVISGLAAGTAAITITPKFYPKGADPIIVNITIGDEVEIAKMYVGDRKLEKDTNVAKAAELITVDSAGELSIDPVTYKPVITFTKGLLSKGNQIVDINVKAFTWKDKNKANGYADNKNYNVKSNWKTSDTDIAVVENSTSIDNHNRITVKKGKVGETVVYISTLNTGEKNPNELYPEYEDNIAEVIIRVIDPEPRLADPEIIVNHQLDKGTPISIVPVYGYDIDLGTDISICKKVVSGTKVTYEKIPEFDYVMIDEEDGYWYVRTVPNNTKPPVEPGKKLDYKNKLYLKGEYKAGGGDFEILIPSITIINELPKVKVTQSGNINMFYNRHADKADLGEVVATQTVTGDVLEVDRYELVSDTNNTRAKSERARSIDGNGELEGLNTSQYMVKDEDDEVPFDSFAYNFDIKKIEDIESKNYGQALITRSKYYDDIAKKDNKSFVVSGYLHIWYKGYRNPVKVKMTVNNKNTAPSYLLSKTKATAHVDATGQEYVLYLYKKGTTNVAANRIDLSKTYVLNSDGTVKNMYVQFDKSISKESRADFNQEVLQNVTMDGGLKDSYLRLKVADGKKTKGKAAVGIHMTTWSDPKKYLFYSFTLSQTDKKSVKLNPNTITLNKAYYGVDNKDEQFIEAVPSTEDAKVVKMSNLDYEQYKNQKNESSYGALAELIVLSTNGVTIKQPKTETAAEHVANGTYSFKVTPTIRYTGSIEDQQLAPLVFKIKVIKKNPTLSVGAFTLNANDEVKTEVAKGKIKIGNPLSKSMYIYDPGTGLYTYYEVDITGVDTTFTRKKNEVYNYTDFNKYVANVNFFPATNEATAMKGEDYDVLYGTYTVDGATVTTPGGCTAKLAKFKMTFKANKKRPSVKVKAKGTINMIINSSDITYTTTLVNVQGRITGVKAMELDEAKDVVESRFIAKRDVNNPNIIYLRMRRDWTGKATSGWNSEEMVPNKTYTVRLYYGIDCMSNRPDDELSEDHNDAYVDVKVKPVAKYPKLTTKARKTTVYAGQDRTDEKYYIEITTQVEKSYRGMVSYDYNGDGIKEVTEPYINLKTVDWKSKGVSDAIKGAFSIEEVSEYDPATGKITAKIKLMDASQLKQNKTYSLDYSTMYEPLQRYNEWEMDEDKRVKPIKYNPLEGTSFAAKIKLNK